MDSATIAPGMAWPERTYCLGDGREIHAVYEGDPVGWVAWLDGLEDRPVAARDIHDALMDLLAPGDGLWPDWFIGATKDLAALDTEAGRRYPCPCCEQPTLDEPPPGTFDICKECGWEDDDVQFHSPDLCGGANAESLNEAQENYAKYGSHMAPPWPTPRTRSELPRAVE